MGLDLVLSDLATVFKEFEDLQSQESRLEAIYGNFSASIAVDVESASDLDVVIVDYPSVDDQINIFDDTRPGIESDQEEIRITDEFPSNQDEFSMDSDDFLSVSLLDLDEGLSLDVISKTVDSLRQKLDTSIANLRQLIVAMEQETENATRKIQALREDKVRNASKYQLAVDTETREYQTSQAKISNRIRKHNMELSQVDEELKKWWILPKVVPFFFHDSLNAVKTLRDQIKSTNIEGQQATATHDSMLDWYENERKETDGNISTQIINVEQNSKRILQTNSTRIRIKYQEIENEVLPEYRRLLNLWLEQLAQLLITAYPDLSGGAEPLQDNATTKAAGLRVGTLISDQLLEPIPAILDPFGNYKHIFITGGSTTQRTELLHNIMYRICTTFPIGMARFLLIDKTELGGALKLFGSRLHKDLANGRVFDHERDIEEQLRAVRAKTSQITQNILSEHPSIDDFNAANPDIPIPHQFIVISNFPNGFSQQALAALEDILKNGPRTGTYIFSSVSDNLPQRDFVPSNFFNANYILSLDAMDTISWNSEYLPSFRVAPDQKPSDEFLSGLLSRVNKIYKERPTSIEYDRLARFMPPLWSLDTIQGLHAPVGLTFGGEIQEIRFDDEVVHGLIGGITGSGKTVLMHDIICGLAQCHSPEDLDLYLLDFKGTEFDVYAKNGLPHARVVAVSCDPEVGFEIIRDLNQEMERRRELFNKEDVQDIQSYKEKGLKLPRILLIIDEVQYIIQRAPSQTIERALEADLVDLFRRGRSMGIHVLIGTQSPSGVLSGSMLQQLKIRICMMADTQVSNLVLGSTNDGASGLQKKGEAVYNDNFGAQSLNKFFRAAHLRREKVAELVGTLGKKTNEVLFTPSKPMYYFTGELSETLLSNEFIKEKISREKIDKSGKFTIPLGTAIGPKKDIIFPINRERYGNAILLGGGGDGGDRNSGTEQLHSLFMNMLVALCVQMPVQHSQFFLIDLTAADSPLADRLRVFQKMPHDFQFAYSSQVATDILESVYEILRERKENARAGRQDELSVILAIFGAENYYDLRSGDRYTPSETRKKLEEILRDGPFAGIHTIVAAQTLAKGEILKADEFGVRISLQVSEDDSRILFDSEIGVGLGEKRGIYKRREWKKTEKFKFYIPLSDDQIVNITNRLTERENREGKR